jgi:hypothetical protein
MGIPRVGEGLVVFEFRSLGEAVDGVFIVCSPTAVDWTRTRSQREATSFLHGVCSEWNKRGIRDAANNEGICPDKP